MLYKVSDTVFEITDSCDSKAWKELAPHYKPFEIHEGSPIVHMDICKGRIDCYDGWTLVHADTQVEEGQISLRVMRNVDGDTLFEITQPSDTCPMAWLSIDKDLSCAIATIDEDNPEAVAWHIVASLTACAQLAFMLATNSRDTVMTHSSAILYEGQVYLFQGKSGTGKSTHSRMWLESVEGAEPLNDDHPIIRIDSDGNAIAYGSPWSGKTHCYRNLQAPIGGIVRIKRAPYNKIRRLSPIEAYASLLPTFFSMPFDKDMTDKRHHTIEKIIMSTPCYELSCLPDHDAAQCCLNGVASKA